MSLFERNPKLHNRALIADAIRRYGLKKPLRWEPTLNGGTGAIVAGNGRIATLREMHQNGEPPPRGVRVDSQGMWLVPILVGVDAASESEAQSYAIDDNNLVLAGTGLSADDVAQLYDRAAYLALLEELKTEEEVPSTLDEAELDALLDEIERICPPEPPPEPIAPSLCDRFVVPPFSVLDTRQGYWLTRKRQWMDLGIASEAGRGETPDSAKQTGGVLMKSVSSHPAYYRQKTAAEKRLGRVLTNDEFERDHWVMPDGALTSGNSVFDPVLCELAYRWFCPSEGTVLDPFAGGSVRGIVAARLGLQYVGIELRGEQVAANREQALKLCGGDRVAPVWHQGDSRDLDRIAPDLRADLVFSCPPYADLEVYSNDPNDLSTLNYPDFLRDYEAIIGKAIDQLRDDRFAVWVVGDLRDTKTGFYRNFVADSIACFQKFGAVLYNEAILINQAGSLPMRVAKQFQASRKLGKSHQNVLVFFKGNPKRIKDVLGEVAIDLSLFEEGEDEG